MKKTIIILLLLIGGLMLGGCSLKKNQDKQVLTPEPTAIPTKPIEESVKEAPFVSLIPTADGHWVTLQVENLKKGSQELGYELTYFADAEGNKIERGVSTGSKPVDLAGATKYSKKILFGSESCTTGICKYRFDENVSEGKLILKISDSNKTEKYETVFKLQKGSEAANGFDAGDGIFTLVSENLSKSKVYLTGSTAGLPLALPEELVAKSVAYATFPLSTLKGTVSFKTSDEATKIMYFDGAKWQELTSTFNGGIISASVAKSGIFILVK